MSLQLKLTLQKIKTIRILILISTGISIVILLGFILSSCGIQHITITNDLKSYEKSFDPEFCDSLVDKINLFNDDGEPKVEILDCG